MTTPAEMTPSGMARWAGVLFLATIVGGVIAQAFISDRLVITGDAAATARNIVANPGTIRLAFSLFMVEMIGQIATTAVMCELLKPVDRRLARLSAVFGYTGSTIKIIARLFFYAPLFVLSGASYLSVFSPAQLDALAYLLTRINNHGAAMACIFLGANTLIVGFLMLRARFLPRALGVIGLVGGAGWLTFIYPPLGNALFMPIAIFALVGSAVTIGWLVIRGVDEPRWFAAAEASAASTWR